MKKLSSSPWLERLAARRVVVAIAVGAVCALLGVPRAWGDPPGLLLALAAAAVITGLTYQCLGLTGRVRKLMASNVELARTNATLNESVAASRAARQDLARQKMLAESLLAVARATGQRPVLEATLQNTLAISLALTGATHGSLFLFDANGRVVRHLLARQDIAPQEARALVGQVMTEGLAGWTAQHRQATRVADTQTDSRWLALPDEPAPIRSALAVPLISRDALVGVLTLMHSTPRHFTEEHEQLLSDAADQVALALDNARMFDTMTRLTDRLSLLYEVSQMAAQQDLDLTLTRTVRAVRAATGWATVAAFLLDAERTLVAWAAAGDSAQDIIERRSPPSGSVVERAVSTVQAQLVCSAASEIAAPIHIGQRVLGVLGSKSAQPDAFTDQDLELLSAVADTLAMAVAYVELAPRQAV